VRAPAGRRRAGPALLFTEPGRADQAIWQQLVK
jgi:hypothetical protein